MDRCRAHLVLNAFAKTTVRCMFSLSCISMETLTGVLSAYSQCREEDDGSWAADPSWECQQPGDKATGALPSTASTSSQPVVAAAASSSQPVVAAAASSSVAAVSTTPDQDSSSDSAGTQSATQGSCDSTIAPSGWDGVASTSVSFASTVSNVFS